MKKSRYSVSSTSLGSLHRHQLQKQTDMEILGVNLPHPNRRLIIDADPLLFCNSLELLLVLVNDRIFVVKFIFRFDRNLGCFLFLDINGESSGKGRVLLTIASQSGTEVMQSDFNSHQTFELGNRQPLLLFLLNCEHNLGAPTQSVSTRVWENLK